jgi:O-antigen/teichoic acid export membrane protein
MKDITRQSISELKASESRLTTEVGHLISGRLLASNAAWNLIGVSAPVLVAILCLPILKRVLGTDRLGVISLAWVIVGYFSVFDFGLSRALTKLVAEKLGHNQRADIPPLIWTGLSLMTGFGLIGGLGAFFLSPWTVSTFVKVPSALQTETLKAFYWLSASIPIVIVTAGLRGVLEALQRFRVATAIRVPLGILTFLGPVLVLPFSHSLVPIVGVLTVVRGLACLAHLWACFQAWPELRHEYGVHSSSMRSMIHFGGWMTVTNIVGPMMSTFDRFVLGALISVSAVAYYSVPSEMVGRLLLLPVTLMGVLFPAFSTAHAADRDRFAALFESGLRYILVTLFPITVALVALAPDGLRFWLGNDFAQNSSAVLRYLAVAVFISSVSQVPFALLQGAGRPDITAKLHLFELPLYGVTLFALVKLRGIEGAAIASLLRVTLDAVLLFFFSYRLLPRKEFLRDRLPILMAGAFMILAAGALDIGFTERLIFVVSVCTGSLLASWFWILSPGERFLVQEQLRGSNAGK